jgi:hypothetical protein
VKPAHTRHIEPRWPVALVVLCGCLLLALLPGRVKVFPTWVPYTVTAVFLLPMAALAITTARDRWLRIEAAVTVVVVLFAEFAIVDQLTRLLFAMVHRSAEVSGWQLLSSSVTMWAMNIVIFSIVYWRIDRGGPEARANGIQVKSDWFFPEDAPEIARGWKPTFIDYLFLAFCTATTFSPAEAQPITSRAKLLMMFESTVSLVTIVAVAARAINVLGT